MQKSKDLAKIAKKKKILYSLLGVLAVLVIGILYFIFTGKSPTKVIPVKELKKPTYLFSIYGDEKTKRLNSPLGVAVNENEKIIYAADTRNSRVAAFDFNGKMLYSFKKIKDKELQTPSYIAVNPNNDDVYVADTGYASIFIFAKDGKFKEKFIPNNNKKFPWVPLGMKISNDIIYVVDKGLNRVVTFNLKGKRLKSIGKSAQVEEIKDKPGGLYFPNALDVTKNGDIYVSDSNNQRVQIFNEKGKFKKLFAVKGLPRGIDVIEGGAAAGVYVVNVFDHQVQVFDKDGEAQYVLGEIGEGEGQFRYPNDLTISANKIYIADTANNRIQVWRF